jgi:hypothetical protein
MVEVNAGFRSPCRTQSPGRLRAAIGLAVTLQLACSGVLPATAAPTAAGHEEERSIVVRFVDPRSGKPIRNMWVGVTQFKSDVPKGPIPAEYVLSTLSAKTDQNGAVFVTLHDPAPAFIAVHSFDLWYSGFLISVSEVLKSGVVLNFSNKGAPRGCWTDSKGRPVMESGMLLNHADSKDKGPPRVNPAPKPGEIVYVERRLTRWDRMRMELP